MPKSFAPYSGNAEFIESAFAYLGARAKRLVAEQDARQATNRECAQPIRQGQTSARDARLQVVALKEREDRLSREMESRLAAHRRSKTAKLGLDALTEKHKLTGEERMVLLICTTAGFGQRVIDDVLSGYNTFYSGVSVQDLIDLLAPDSLSDRLRFRGELFRPDAKLVKAGLIHLSNPSKPVSPSTLLALEVTLDMAAFSIIVGDAFAAREIAESES